MIKKKQIIIRLFLLQYYYIAVTFIYIFHNPHARLPTTYTYIYTHAQIYDRRPRNVYIDISNHKTTIYIYICVCVRISNIHVGGRRETVVIVVPN